MSKEYFSNDLFLGIITQINAYNCFIKIPKPSLLQSFFINGNNYCGGIVGRYVVVRSENFGFLGILQEVAIPKESEYSIDEKEIQNENEIFKTGCRIQLLLSFDYNSSNTDYGSGIKEFPMVSSKVYICHNELLQKILSGLTEKNNSSLLLGEVTGSTIPYYISIRDLFERHCAIVGTTGGGKSSTIGLIIEKINEYNISNQSKPLRVILFDATGEFESLNPENVRKYKFGVCSTESDNKLQSVYFSYKNFSTSDWFSLFQPSVNVQSTKLREAIKSLKLQQCLNQSKPYNKAGEAIETFNKSVNNHANKVFNEEESNFNITLLSQQISNECIYANDFKDALKFGGKNQQDEGYCSPLINKINYKVNNKLYNKIFRFSDDNEDCKDIKTEFIENDTAIKLISLKDVSFDDNLRQVLMNCIGRALLDMARKGDFKDKPTILFIDEAHQFLNKHLSGDYAPDIPLNAFDNIAKECRKHGLYLCLSTQIARDIPSGTLSQMRTFIVHRLINEEDKNKIKDACQESTREIMSYLPILGKGECIMIGS